MAQHPSHRITEEPLTLDEEYEQQRINAMPEPLQRLALLHHLDQYEATPSYTGRYQPAEKHGKDQTAIETTTKRRTSDKETRALDAPTLLSV